VNLFRRPRPAPYDDDPHHPDELPGMPPRPSGCRPPAPELPLRGAWDSKGAVDASYDPCGVPLSRTPETRRNA
jgi:hypothetical protein